MSAAHGISIALPVYNGSNHLREALESILSQDLSDFTLVVSDNCSTDATPEILAEYARRDRRVRVVRAPTFLGQQQNTNRAVELCDTQWVKLFCHDDVMAPRCIRVISDVVRHASDRIGLVSNGERWLFANGYVFEPAPQAGASTEIVNGRSLVRATLRGRARVSVPSLTTATVRKSAWLETGRFDSRFIHFDTFFWIRLLVDWDLVHVPEVLTTNRIHSAQVAAGARRSQRSMDDMLEFWPEFVREHRERLDAGWFSGAVAHLKPLSAAATLIAIELLRRRPSNAFAIAARLPRHWLPALPALVVRNLRAESARLKPLLPHVPIEMIYP